MSNKKTSKKQSEQLSKNQFIAFSVISVLVLTILTYAFLSTSGGKNKDDMAVAASFPSSSAGIPAFDGADISMRGQTMLNSSSEEMSSGNMSNFSSDYLSSSLPSDRANYVPVSTNQNAYSSFSSAYSMNSLGQNSSMAVIPSSSAAVAGDVVTLNNQVFTEINELRTSSGKLALVIADSSNNFAIVDDFAMISKIKNAPSASNQPGRTMQITGQMKKYQANESGYDIKYMFVSIDQVK